MEQTFCEGLKLDNLVGLKSIMAAALSAKKCFTILWKAWKTSINHDKRSNIYFPSKISPKRMASSYKHKLISKNVQRVKDTVEV